MILAPVLKEIAQDLIEKKQSEKQQNNQEQEQKETPQERVVEKSSQPIAQKNKPSPFSIKATLEKKKQKEENTVSEVKKEELPNNHFTETDLQKDWILFLEDLQQKDIVIYNAINGFKLSKIDENIVQVLYPSSTAKSEFDKIQGQFFNKFKHKVNNYQIEVTFKKDTKNLKKEIVTKRTIYEKYIEINPLLKDLDDVFKFDFN